MKYFCEQFVNDRLSLFVDTFIMHQIYENRTRCFEFQSIQFRRKNQNIYVVVDIEIFIFGIFFRESSRKNDSQRVQNKKFWYLYVFISLNVRTRKIQSTRIISKFAFTCIVKSFFWSKISWRAIVNQFSRFKNWNMFNFNFSFDSQFDSSIWAVITKKNSFLLFMRWFFVFIVCSKLS